MVRTEAECRTYFESRLASEVSLLRSYVESGRARWDAAAASACIAEIEAATCADLAGLIFGSITYPPRGSACAGVVIGLEANGATCGTGLFCASGFCEESGVTGTCADGPGVGEACTRGCAGDLYCDTFATDPRCAELLPNGAACSPGSDGACESEHCDDAGVCTDRPPLTYCIGT
jgi:hypothetical protein